ncbi:MAG TPA: sugar phosphate isomerase/epimerase [Tepidisphaeraceae bacterium]|jgi:sugar phosphate isomerase/epimerase|nr:sugar phosphate isomerase/epimerase [Tepidisphaeraceae bacterium]
MPTALRFFATLSLLAVCSLACKTANESDSPAPEKKAKTSKDSVKDSKELVSDPKPSGVAVKPKVNNAAIDKAGFRLSVQAYTFREMSLLETIDTLKFLGVHYVELYPGQKFSKDNPKPANHDMPPEMLSELLQKLRDADVKAVNYGVVGLSKDEAASRKVFDWAKKMGLETIVSEPTPDKETFDVVEKLCEEFQINVAIHDHPYPSTYWYPQKVLEVTKGRSNRIGSCSDTGHWYRSGFIVTECIDKLKGRVISLHLKDLNKDKQDVPWGTGMIHAKDVMATLMAQKPAHKPVWSIEYESSHGTELVNNVGKCCENFGKFCEELTK